MIFSQPKTASKFLFNLAFFIINACKGIINISLMLLILGLAALYYQTEIYDFKEGQPFRGSSFYNPYAKWDSHTTAKANFHAHSVAWKGVTNGHNTHAELNAAYQEKGYSIAPLSNYHEQSTESLSVYEHGFNLLKSHKLAIGADKVSFLDYPLWQTKSQKQQIIEKLKDNGALVALAHPNIRNGHSLEDLKYLDHYDFIEVFSAYANALNYWDQALMHGKAVWCMANDDTHDLAKQQIGRFFNVLAGHPKTAKEIKNTLKSGSYVSLKSPNTRSNLMLEKMQISDGEVQFEFSGDVQKVRAIADAKVIAEFHKNEGRLSLPDWVHYVRFEAENGEDILLTNPLIKTNSPHETQANLVSINWTQTLFYRFTVLLVAFTLLFSLALRWLPFLQNKAAEQ